MGGFSGWKVDQLSVLDEFACPLKEQVWRLEVILVPSFVSGVSVSLRG